MSTNTRKLTERELVGRGGEFVLHLHRRGLDAGIAALAAYRHAEAIAAAGTDDDVHALAQEVADAMAGTGGDDNPARARSAVDDAIRRSHAAASAPNPLRPGVA
jgi:hypothetical protein